MMLPILISVSVAPVSYFFWASAPVLVAANTIMVAHSTCSRSRKAGMIDLLRSAASIRFDDLVRAFLVANDLTDAIVIALDHAGGNDEFSLKTFELAGPTRQSAIVRRAWQEVALLENLIAFIVGVSAESVEFHGLR